MKEERKTLLVAICLVVSVALVAFSGTTYTAEGANPPQCAISIAFDDGTRNQFDYAFQLMKARGMVGTYYVTTDLIRDFSGKSNYISIAEIQTLQTDGNEIGSHCKTHTPLNTLSNESIREEFSASKQLLQSYGLTVDNVAYPHGATNPTVDSIAPEYYRSARLHRGMPDFVMHFPVSQPIIVAWPGETGNATTVIPRLKWMVDHIYSEKGWGIIYFHNVIPNAYNSPYTISTQDFAVFLDYVLSRGIPTITVNQGLDAALPPEKMKLTTTTNCGTVSPASGAYNIGEIVQILATPPTTGTNERYVFNGWTGKGSGSYNGYSNPSTVTMDDYITQTASWRHEFKLTVSAYGGSTTPAAGDYWFEEGTEVTIQATPSSSENERQTWLGWSGSGSGSYNGTANSAVITMNNPITQTASWQTEFKLTVSTDLGSTNPSMGEYWFMAGSSVEISASAPIAGAKERYVWTGWSGTGSGSYSGTEASVLININGPISEHASWIHQFFMDVSSPYGVVNGSGWFNASDTRVASIDAAVIDLSPGIRVVFSGWSGDASGSGLFSDVIVMDQPLSAVALWKKQFFVVFNQTGLPEDSNVSVVINSENNIVPFSYWVEEGTSVQFNYPNQHQTWFGARYLLTAPSNQSSIEIDSPKTITAEYNHQYTTELFGAATLPIAIAALIILLRRKTKKGN